MIGDHFKWQKIVKFGLQITQNVCVCSQMILYPQTYTVAQKSKLLDKPLLSYVFRLYTLRLTFF